MKGHCISSSHHCKSIKNPCTCSFVSLRTMIDCHDFCQSKQYQYPSYISQPVYPSPYQYPTYYSTPLFTVQQWPCMPSSCNPSFYRPCYSKKIKIEQKLLYPSSNRITVRRITPPHVAVRKYRNKDSDQFMSASHRQFETTQTVDLSEKDHLNSNIENIPSVPSMKIVSKNDGIQASSTSFITTTDDRISFVSDDTSENSTEHYIIRPRSSHELSFTTAQVNKSNNINEMTTSTNEIVTIKSDVDKSINILNEKLITKQAESIPNNTIDKHSSITTDKTEGHKRHSAEEVKSLFEHESNSNVVSTNDSIIEQPFIDLSQQPSLPSSLPPNINTIKSNEMLPYLSRSITSLINEKQKSSTDIKNPSLPLRNARSTLDFGLLLDEITTKKF